MAIEIESEYHDSLLPSTSVGAKRLSGRVRRAFQALLDAVAWSVAIVAAEVLRYDLSLRSADWVGVVLVLIVTIALQFSIGTLAGLYRHRWRFGSFEEVAALAETIGAVTVLVFLLNLTVFDRFVPASVPLGAGVGALTLCGAIRYTLRLLAERRLRPKSNRASRLLVFGAGEGAAQVITSMLRTPASPYIPVALLDDDPAKRHLRIRGVSVVGTRADIRSAARKFGADSLLIAIPSAPAEVVRELSRIAASVSLDLRVLPSISELIGGSIAVRDIRPATESDLMGRHQIDINVDSIAQYLTGRRVLVTGAGGSIGSELCRQIQRFTPSDLVMLDRDESALHAVELSIAHQALLDSDRLAVGDIRDRDRLLEIFRRHRPEVVFHAAALKHLPLLELHCEEAVKTNVYGTQNVLDAANEVGAERFVNVSTDKAANPISVLGYTKRIAERITAFAAEEHDRPYLSVRFGNVLGSRGSVIETFRAQIANGGPVTVTDPEVTRYFMTAEEAVQLIIQAGAAGRPGEVLVLDMGSPVYIAEVARRLIDADEREVGIVYTGLRPGEKLHEDRLAHGEADLRPVHPLISHVCAPPLDPTSLEHLASTDRDVVSALARLSRTAEPQGTPLG